MEGCLPTGSGASARDGPGPSEGVIFQGVLSKQSSGALRRWQKRLFVLTGNNLVYYQVKNAGVDSLFKQKSGKGAQSGGIDVRAIRRFSYTGEKLEFAFDVKGSHPRSISPRRH